MANVGVGVYLETLLDEVCQGEGEDVGEQEIAVKAQKNHITVYQHVDAIQQAAADSALQNGDLEVERVKALQKGVQLPGVNRYMMPPAKDVNLRKSKQQQQERLITQDLDNFNHRKHLVTFERLLKQFQPKRSWDLKNRVYEERLDADCLRQALNESFLLDSHTLTHYDEDYDRLYLIVVFKNPPGRILRRQWFYEDKIVPNLQYFYKMKEVSDKKTYYDEDCLKLGNISEKTKYLYPNDLSLIIQRKLQYGETQINSNVFFNTSHTMGIDQNPTPFIWLRLAECGSRLVIEQTSEMASTLTLAHGLTLKFLHNGDILQQFERIPQVMKRTF